MDHREIEELIDRIERLKAKQAEIERMQRQMAEQLGSVKKAIDVEQETVHRLIRTESSDNGPPAG